MPYSGAGKNPYWASIGYSGTSAPGMLSEKVPVVVDGVTQYFLNVTATPDNATWASGYRVNLNFYDVNGSSTGSAGFSTSGSLTAGVNVTLQTAPMVAPANSVTVQAQVEYIGAPASTNPLRVYEADIYTQANTSQPVIVNQNYMFVHATDPWTAYNGALLDWNFNPLSAADGDSDSLVIDDLFELMGGTPPVESVIPELVDPTGGHGAIFRIPAPGGTVSFGSGAAGPYDLGTPQPTADVVESLLMDGERPFGRRSSNRTITIPVAIFAPTLATLAAARELLLQAIDQQTWKLTWRPASTGLPLEYECFRANPSVVTYGFNYNREGAANSAQPQAWAQSVVTLTFSALPYGKSGQDGIQQVDFTDGVLDAGAVAPSVVIDDYGVPTTFNDFNGGTNGTTISVANSGTANGHTEVAFSTVSIGAGAGAIYTNAQAAPGSSLSAQISTGASSTAVKLIWANVGPATGYKQYFQFYIRTAAYPAARSNLVFISDSTDTLTLGKVAMDATGHISMDSATVQGVITSTNAVPLNTWTRVSGFFTSSATAGQVGFSMYYTSTEGNTPDETKTSVATLNTNGAVPGSWQVGVTNGGVLSFTYFLGNLEVGSSVPLTAYTTATTQFSPGGGTWSKNTAYFIAGSQSARYSAPVPAKVPWAAAVYSADGLLLNLTGMKVIYLWFGQSYDTQWTADKKFISNVTLSWTLTDVNGKRLSFSGRYNKCPWGANPNRPVWVKVTSAIPQGKSKAQFDYSRVTAYSVRITNWAGSGATGYQRMHAWISRAIAGGATTKWIDTPHAHIYSVFAMNGIARTPITAQVQLPASNPVTQELTQTGTWPVPKGVTSVFGEAWGGGGGGGSVSGVSSGLDAGGGGGGEYAAEAVITTIPGTKVPVNIGAGGSGGQVVVRTVTFTRAGTSTWTAPANVTSYTAEIWGGGAAGAPGGGGGGGGSYTKGTNTVTPGKTYPVHVGPGGKANTGTLSKDQAARHGGDSTAGGDSGTLHAPGGSSSTSGGSTGGTGGARYTTVEPGTTITFSSSGGNGGNSPGAAGGGGGTSGGRTATGLRGADSPRGSNNYASGGPATPSADGGGTGGKGADVGGIPGKGAQPGGGGGGGYTKNANYAGAAGGTGQVIITYQENLGNPINGGATSFGQSGLTNKVLTANGGSSPALNTSTGAAGGTGSSNTVHFNGGKGAMSGNNKEYLYRVSDNGGGGWVRQGAAQATATSVTSGTATASLTTGLAIVAAETINPVLGTTSTVTDTAGNKYDLISQVQLPSSGAYLSTWVAKIGAALASGSTTVTLAVAGTAQKNTIAWFTSAQYGDIDVASLATNSGTSVSPSVTWSNADTGSRKGTFIVTMNNSTTDTSSLPTAASWLTSDTTTSSKYVNGTVEFAFFAKELPGGSGSVTATSTLAGSVAWAAIALPLIPQDVADPYLMKIGTDASTGTTSPVAFTNAFGIPAGRGYMMIACQFAGTPGTVTFTDASGNTWTQQDTVAVGTSTLRTYTAPATNAYTTASTVTLNDTTSQAHRTTLYYVHEAQSVDTSLNKTATGTSTAPAITTNAPTLCSDLQLVIFANNNSVDPTVDPSGNFVNWGNESNGTMHATTYAIRVPGRTTYTPTGTYAGSQTWGAIAMGFASKIALGSGGSSGGPLGAGNDGTDSGGTAWEGGGKGAPALVSASGSGSPAALPGGGGSGAASSDTSSLVGGSGASGMVRITYQPPLQTMNDLILHRPGPGARNSLCPVVTIPPNDPPDNREYAVPSLIAGKNAEFFGTYSVFAMANAWNGSTTGVARRVSVTVNQYEYKGGPAVSVQATKIVTPATDIVNGYVDMGPLTLPIRDYDESDDEVYYTVSIHDTDTGDSFQDVLFLDTAGQTILVNIAPGTAADGLYSSFYVDEPTIDKAMGQLLGSGHGRERAVSVLDMAFGTGGPLYVESGENLLLAYSTGGAPNLGVTYTPRWYTDRIR